MSHPPIALIVPGDPDQPTGGYRYDAHIAAELGRLGVGVEVIGLPGRFPDADAEAGAAMDAALRARPHGGLAVIDGLALGGLPAVAQRHATRLELVALVHHPLADETGLVPALRQRFAASEARALAACRRIVTTSEFTARRLAAFGVQGDRIRVVPPGVAPAAARAPGASGIQRLLCVGSLVPRKGQDLLIDALAGLRAYAWCLELVGDADREPDFAASVRARIARHGLTDRVALSGVQDPVALDTRYRHSDVLLVPSHYEGYGMVVTEALARGLPLIATTGGALVDTVPPAAALQVPPGDLDALRAALRRWFDEPDLRTKMTTGALDARRELEDWPAAGRRFAAALGLQGPGDTP